MTIRHVTFANLGRDKNPHKTTKWIDRQAIQRLSAATPDWQAAVVLCEIGEGDDDDELKLVLNEFKGWTLYGRTTREPVLLSPDQPRAKATVQWVPNTAVKHWSPPRSWLTVNLADEPVSILSGHPPAGAHGQGDRPDWAKPLLNKGFDNMRAAKVRRVDHLHNRGRNVICVADENDYAMPDVHPRVKTVWHQATDYGQVIPADGWTADWRAGERVRLGLDSHLGHTMDGRFRQA